MKRIDLIEDNESGSRADRIIYDERRPDAPYTIPDRNAHQSELMETQIGEGQKEGFLHYFQDRVQFLIQDEHGDVLMVEEEFAMHDQPMIVLPSLRLETTDDFESLPSDRELFSTSFGNAKYHTRQTLTFLTSDQSILKNKKIHRVKLNTPEEIDAFVLENSHHCDTALIDVLFRRKMQLQGHEITPTLPVIATPDGVRVSHMGKDTSNWFKFLQVDTKGVRIEKVLSTEEVLAVGMTIHGFIRIMRERVPALKGNETILLPGGGWKSTDTSGSNALLRELQEEIGEDGEATPVGIMHANPDIMNNGSHLFAISELFPFDGEAEPDEDLKPVADEIHPDEIIHMINRGEIVDQRVVSGLYLALLWFQKHERE